MNTMRVGAMQLVAAAAAFAPLGAAAQTFRTLYSFGATSTQPNNPAGDIVFAKGAVFGTSLSGGADGWGALFKVNAATGAGTTIVSFKYKKAPVPTGVSYSHGALFGVSEPGADGGWLWTARPHQREISLLYNFPGGAPLPMTYETPIEVGSILYGVMTYGGTNHNGYVYAFDTVSNTETVLYTFGVAPDAVNPAFSLTYNGGFLYGVSQLGGVGGAGAIFKIDTATNAESIIYSFNGSKVGVPSTQLTYRAGKLYGAAYVPFYKPGRVYEFTLKSGKLRILHTFAGRQDGSEPTTGVLYENGVVYGTTRLGGSFGHGTVYAVNVNTKQETILHSFSGGTDGASPLCNLVYDGANIYGTTQTGGQYNKGTVFKLTP